DNFHTGYNLCALQAIGRFAETTEFEPAVELGLDYYRRHFFREDGAPRYYHNRTYPIDIHSVAQSVLTLLAFRERHPDLLPLARQVLAWGLDHMWDERGYFYCQQHPRYTVRIPYMRWAQAWMLLTLASFLESTAAPGDRPHASSTPSLMPSLPSSPALPARLTYTVVTPARNEEAYIEQALRAMVAQTAAPIRWVIVSDGSTDRTDEIVLRYAAERPWIELFRRPPQGDRSFASKAHAIRDGVERLQDLRYDVIVNLDADVSFGPDYFEFLLEKFAQNPKLGLAGTAFEDPSLDYDYRF